MRFAEFTEGWEDVTLGNCSLSIDYGMNAAAIKFDGENRYIRITDIDESSSKYKFESPVSPAKGLTDKFLVKENDILFARTGASTGKSYHYDSNDGKLYFAGFLIRARIRNIYNSHFIFLQTQTQKYDKWVKLMSMRSGQPGINSQEYSSYLFKIPTKFEQDKISLLLIHIDSRIQTQRKIIDDLIVLKNSVINKIFDGKLKFKSEEYNSSDLELKRLSEFLSIPTKIKPDKIDKEKLLTVKLHLKGVHKNVKSETLSIGATNYFIRKKGQFIYGKQNLFNGAFAIIPDHYDGFLSSADVPTLEINSEKLNGKYLFYLFSRESFYKKLEDISSGSGSKRIHETDLLKVKILVPSLKEQNKIVEFLSSLDEKTHIEKGLLINYENQKKYLLTNLFV